MGPIEGTSGAWPKVEELGAKITWQGFDQLA
jgi:hypothetical protein